MPLIVPLSDEGVMFQEEMIETRYANIPGNVAIMRWRSIQLSFSLMQGLSLVWQEYMRPLLVQVGVCH